MEIEIIWIVDHEPRKETLVYWDWHEPIYRVNPDRQPTEEELAACPKMFRCYCCLEKHPARELGGRYYEKWFCSGCIPYIDEWTAGAMVWWELKRKKRIDGQPKSSKPITKLERLESLVAIVRWAKANGYPVL